MKTAAFAEHRHLGADAGEIIGSAFVNLVVNFTISYLMKKNDISQISQSVDLLQTYALLAGTSRNRKIQPTSYPHSLHKKNLRI